MLNHILYFCVLLTWVQYFFSMKHVLNTSSYSFYKFTTRILSRLVIPNPKCSIMSLKLVILFIPYLKRIISVLLSCRPNTFSYIVVQAFRCKCNSVAIFNKLPIKNSVLGLYLSIPIPKILFLDQVHSV